MKKLLKKSMFVVALVLLVPALAAHAAVIQIDRQEVIQRSKLIFVGSVQTKNARWNDKGNLIVTDYIFKVDDTLFGECGKTVTFTFAGGQLADEGQAVSDVPEYKVGDVILLMIEDSETPIFSPVTGMYQGSFVAADSGAQYASIVLNGEGKPLRDKDGGLLVFGDFIEIVKNEIPKAKSNPLPDRSVPEKFKW
jgi:hypothetical protein